MIILLRHILVYKSVMPLCCFLQIMSRLFFSCLKEFNDRMKLKESQTKRIRVILQYNIVSTD